MAGRDTTWAGIGSLSRLPDWLLAAADGVRVGAGLEQALQAAGGSPVMVHACRPEHFRLKTDAWSFLCPVTVSIGGDAPAEVVLEGRLQRPGTPSAAHPLRPEPFGSPGWRCVLAALGIELQTAPPDQALPELPILTDADRARAVLEQAIRAGAGAIPGSGYAAFRLAGCRPQVMRYARGSRCTIRYQLDYLPGQARPSWPQVVVAKTYRADKGDNAYRAMTKLWASDLARSPSVTIAEPLGYLPDLRVLVQGPVAEDTTLKELVRSALREGSPASVGRLDPYLAKTAAGLAAMHGCGVALGETVTLEDEVVEIATLIDRLAAPLPEVARAAGPLLERVTQVAGRHPAEPARPSHRAFRPAQVLVHQGRVGFIDFDGFCQAEPALDVALFRAGLRDCGLSAMRSVGGSPATAAEQTESALAAVDGLCDAFLRHYQAVAPVSAGRVMLWETLDLLTYVLHAWSKVRPSRLPPRLVALERFLGASDISA